MNDIEEEIHRKVALWVAYADEDLRLAEHAFKLIPPPFRLIAYHAQQCAEKYLKAYLVLKLIDFPYTHNISLLLELCAEEAKWPESLLDAEKLSAFSITTRYPGEDKQVTKDEAKNALELASRVRKVVRKVITEEGMTLEEDASQ